MTKTQVVKMLVKSGYYGVPEAVKIYNLLSNNGWYEVEKKDLKPYIE